METAQEAMARVQASMSEDAKKTIKRVLEIEKSKLYVGHPSKAALEREIAEAIKELIK